LPLLDAAEVEQLRSFNATAVDYADEHLLHRLVKAQAHRTPDAEAVRCGGHALAYAELDRRAGRLASRLRALGVGPDVPVGVCLDRSCELVVALYGVLKAGGCYVPLDPDYPADRLAFMLNDAAPPVVLTQTHLADRLPRHAAETILLDDDWGADADGGELADPGLTPDHLAYVIYTSGSTGTPKGAANAHRGICNRLLWMQEAYRLTGEDTVLQKTPASFDVSVWEFFWPLLAGARLVLARPGGHKDPAYLADLIRDEHVTVCHFVPSMLEAFLREPDLAERCASLRDVVCSGEALSHALQERFFARLPARLHNLYGPTEAAVDVTYWECRRNDPRTVVPIGRPIANTQMHVLDKHGHEVPVGMPGELYIGGVGLARGYHNRPDLTAERFAEHPDFGRLYRTGDIGRWLSDGAIEYLGRTDHQVKVRGCRIELGEVEAALRSHPGVQDAAAAAVGANGDARLVGYLVPAGQGHVSPAALRDHLKARLPEYMVPAAFVTLDGLPLTPSGKLDRKALPTLDTARPGPEASYVAPRNPVEQAVALIWADVLGVERVGAHDNFFDLGGHSLLATQVLSRIRQAYPVDISLRRLFEEPTVANLASAIMDGQRRSDNETIDKVAPDELQILSDLDQMSDDEVDSLLQGALAEEEVT
jgi:amino acid adenylation domain-containing protein